MKTYLTKRLAELKRRHREQGTLQWLYRIREVQRAIDTYNHIPPNELLELIIDAARNDDSERVIRLAEKAKAELAPNPYTGL